MKTLGWILKLIQPKAPAKKGWGSPLVVLGLAVAAALALGEQTQQKRTSKRAADHEQTLRDQIKHKDERSDTGRRELKHDGTIRIIREVYDAQGVLRECITLEADGQLSLLDLHDLIEKASPKVGPAPGISPPGQPGATQRRKLGVYAGPTFGLRGANLGGGVTIHDALRFDLPLLPRITADLQAGGSGGSLGVLGDARVNVAVLRSSP